MYLEARLGPTEQIRVMIIDLEEKLTCKIKAIHPVGVWLVEHTSFILTHCHVGTDGKAPYERHKGKKANFQLCAFGEQVYYMSLKGGSNAGKKAPRYFGGIWLGISKISSEVLYFIEAILILG